MNGGTATTYGVNDVNQYTSLTGAVTASPTYDNNGNMLTDGLGATMTWDAENRMASWEKGTDKLEFVYDGMGRRVEKRKYVSAVLNETIRYLYDELLPVAHLDGTNARTVELSRGLDLSQTLSGAGGIGGLLAYTEGSNASEFYSYDGNGNVVDMMDASDTVVGHYEYSPFGELLASTGASTNPYRWSTKEEDPTSGLVYYLYRYYNPDLGRWINRNPIEEAGGLNLYGFVSNSPINYVDAYGHAAPAVVFFAVLYHGGRFIVQKIVVGTARELIQGFVVRSGLTKRAATSLAGRCVTLAAAVQTAKDAANSLGKCRLTDCCSTLISKKIAWVSLTAARSNLHKICFHGGGPGHQKQLADNFVIVSNCIGLIATLCPR